MQRHQIANYNKSLLVFKLIFLYHIQLFFIDWSFKKSQPWKKSFQGGECFLQIKSVISIAIIPKNY